MTEAHGLRITLATHFVSEPFLFCKITPLNRPHEASLKTKMFFDLFMRPHTLIAR